MAAGDGGEGNMVGENTEMKTLAEIIGTHLREQNGYSCIGLVSRVMDELGRPLPREILGYDLRADEWMALWRDNRAEAERMLQEGFASIGEAVEVSRVSTGDVILVRENTQGQIFPALYCGNGNALSAFVRTGHRVFRIGRDFVILSARRVS